MFIFLYFKSLKDFISYYNVPQKYLILKLWNRLSVVTLFTVPGIPYKYHNPYAPPSCNSKHPPLLAEMNPVGATSIPNARGGAHGGGVGEPAPSRNRHLRRNRFLPAFLRLAFAVVPQELHYTSCVLFLVCHTRFLHNQPVSSGRTIQPATSLRPAGYRVFLFQESLLLEC